MTTASWGWLQRALNLSVQERGRRRARLAGSGTLPLQEKCANSIAPTIAQGRGLMLQLLLAVVVAGWVPGAAAAPACNASLASGEAGCLSCSLCYAYEANALTLTLSENVYDSRANATTFSFLVSGRPSAAPSLAAPQAAGWAGGSQPGRWLIIPWTRTNCALCMPEKRALATAAVAAPSP